ncbi:MAG: endonuclease [Firmicutes bacterium]|nr:endonuclease [Bacillota bacterium]
MDLTDGLYELSAKISEIKDQIQTEEATKNAFIMPFFDLLGYDTRNPIEFVPEFTADVGTKKGEKVDYAIVIDGQTQILIEAKWCDADKLDPHNDQLTRYFTVTNAKIGILTNGIVYKFYTDLEVENKMDSKPFLEVDMLNLKEQEIAELKKFYKGAFNIDNILSTAEILKYSNAIKRLITSQFEDPDDEFISYILGQVYDGRKTQNAKDKFKDIIKKSISQIINGMVRDKLESALETKEEESEKEVATTEEIIEDTPSYETTEEELSGYYIVKSIIAEFTNPKRITYKDTKSYFGVLFEDNTNKWICRLYFNYSQNSIVFPVYDENCKRVSKERFYLDSIEEIYNHRDKFKEIFNILNENS